MSAEEAWDFIAGRYDNYQGHLKLFGYGYKQFIPNHPAIIEMYGTESLSEEQFANYRKIFINEIYNENDLRRLDSAIKEKGTPALRAAADILLPMVYGWGAEIPAQLEIQTTYGCGGSYWTEKPIIIYRMTEHKAEYTAKLLQHEFIHILIEQPIIQKYNVPQNLKERIVDIVGFEYFDKPVQPLFENSFANNYITREVIENNLPSAVEKMMADYTADKK